MKWIKEDKGVFTWMPTLIWGTLILFFSVLPYSIMPALTISWFDKIVHFFEYFILGILVVRAYYRISDRISYRNLSFVLILGSGYGILIELIQRYIPGRSASLTDVVANFAGLLIGIVIGRMILWQK